MADNEEREENTSRGNEWEVVSLTASAYAAAPGPKPIELKDNENGNTHGEEAGTSRSLIMSRHFVFPPNKPESLPLEPDSPPRQHEDLPLEPEDSGNQSHFSNKGVVNELPLEPDSPPSQHEDLPLEPEDSGNQSDRSNKGLLNELGAEEGDISSGKDEEHLTLKGLAIPNEFPGIQYLDEIANRLSTGDFKEPSLQGLNLVDREQSIYDAAKYSSLCSETALGSSTSYGEEGAMPGQIEPSEQDFSSGDVTKFPIPSKDGKCNGFGLPCGFGAWWRRRAASVYAHAKEANAFWSIFVTAAVTGLVILGQRWQQERWQALQFSVNNEKTGRILGSVSRLKDIIVGGTRRGSLISGSSSTEN